MPQRGSPAPAGERALTPQAARDALAEAARRAANPRNLKVRTTKPLAEPFQPEPGEAFAGIPEPQAFRRALPEERGSATGWTDLLFGSPEAMQHWTTLLTVAIGLAIGVIVAVVYLMS